MIGQRLRDWGCYRNKKSMRHITSFETKLLCSLQGCVHQSIPSLIQYGFCGPHQSKIDQEYLGGWQQLADCIFGVSFLAELYEQQSDPVTKQALYQNIRKLFDRIILGVSKMPEGGQRSMVVKLWRILPQLQAIDTKVPAENFACKFLWCLRKTCMGDGPASTFLDALQNMDRQNCNRFLPRLYLFCIDGLNQRVGEDHPVVLNMRVNYCKTYSSTQNWSNASVDTALQLRYWVSIAIPEINSEELVRTLHDLLYLEYYTSKSAQRLGKLTKDLRGLIIDESGRTSFQGWSGHGLAFAFSSRVLASLLLEEGKPELAVRQLEEDARRLFEISDDQCALRGILLVDNARRIRAAFRV